MRAPALGTFLGHHGYAGIQAAIGPSCGERSVRCESITALDGAKSDIRAVNVTVRIDASGGVCDEPAKRVTSACVFPGTSPASARGEYPSGISLLAKNTRVTVQVNGAEVGAVATDAHGRPAPSEQCWSLPATLGATPPAPH